MVVAKFLYFLALYLEEENLHLLIFKLNHMKILSLIIWFLLGIFYFWIWNGNKASCCDGKSSGKTTESSAITSQNSSEKTKDLNKESASSLSAEEKAEKEKIEAEKLAEKEKAEDEAAAKAIAAGAEKNEITTIKTDKKLIFYFPYGSSQSDYSSGTEKDIEEFIALAKKAGKKIYVTGHTDSSSDSDFNMRLGQRRADKVKNKLISKGMASNLIVAQSHGEEEPRRPNTTEENRQQNRRVELEIK